MQSIPTSTLSPALQVLDNAHTPYVGWVSHVTETVITYLGRELLLYRFRVLLPYR